MASGLYRQIVFFVWAFYCENELAPQIAHQDIYFTDALWCSENRNEFFSTFYQSVEILIRVVYPTNVMIILH